MTDVALTYTFTDGTQWSSHYTLPQGVSVRELRDQFAAVLADHTQLHIDRDETDLTAVNPAFVGTIRVATVGGE